VKQTIAELVSRDNTDFTAKEKALIQFARKANREPLRIPAEEFGALRGTGTTDAEILR
jgi:alkylhydroperoxidase family enzyme